MIWQQQSTNLRQRNHHLADPDLRVDRDVDVEQILGFPLIPKDIYFISSLPSDPRASDIVPIAVISIVLSLVATLYPSWRASRVKPAEALRYD